MRNKNTYAYDINMHHYIGGGGRGGANAKNIQMIKTRKKIITHKIFCPGYCCIIINQE